MAATRERAAQRAHLSSSLPGAIEAEREQADHHHAAEKERPRPQRPTSGSMSARLVWNRNNTARIITESSTSNSIAASAAIEPSGCTVQRHGRAWLFFLLPVPAAPGCVLQRIPVTGDAIPEPRSTICRPDHSQVTRHPRKLDERISLVVSRRALCVPITWKNEFVACMLVFARYLLLISLCLYSMPAKLTDVVLFYLPACMTRRSQSVSVIIPTHKPLSLVAAIKSVLTSRYPHLDASVFR